MVAGGGGRKRGRRRRITCCGTGRTTGRLGQGPSPRPPCRPPRRHSTVEYGHRPSDCHPFSCRRSSNPVPKSCTLSTRRATKLSQSFLPLLQEMNECATFTPVARVHEVDVWQPVNGAVHPGVGYAFKRDPCIQNPFKPVHSHMQNLDGSESQFLLS